MNHSVLCNDNQVNRRTMAIQPFGHGPYSPFPACSEIVDLLATACLRHRKREAVKWVKEKTEKTLDDVAQRGKLRTTENRTPEKGA